MDKSKPTSRQERKRQLEEQQEHQSGNQKQGKVRMVPIWFRFAVVIICVVVSMSLGLMVGYGVIGNGEAEDAIKTSTWTYLVDLVMEGTK